MLAAALRYAAMGWFVFPVHSHRAGHCTCDDTGCDHVAKHPLTQHGFLDASRDEAAIRAWWARWPWANVGVATGECSGLLVLDVDDVASAPPEVSSLLGSSKVPRVRTGRGHHTYLAHVHGARSGQAILPGCDVRADGGYVLAPPSLHASGRDYTWEVEPEWDGVSGTCPDLPPAPECLEAALQAVLNADIGGPRPNGFAGHPQATLRATMPTTAVTLPDADVRRLLSAVAVIPAVEREVWIRVGMAFKATGDPRAEDWWRTWSLTCPEKFNAKDQSYQWRRGLKECFLDGHEVTAATIFYLAKDHGWVDEEPAPAAPHDVPPPAPPPKREVEFPAELLSVPGLVGEVAGWIMDTAMRPQPALALGAALAFVGVLFGRRYQSPTNLRTNLYLLGVAESGHGKEHPRAAVKRLAHAAGMVDRLGGESFASGSGVLAALSTRPVKLFLVDEFGSLLSQCVARHAPPHLRDLPEQLLRMFSSASNLFMGKEYASSAQPRRDVREPCLVLYATSTPEQLFAPLSSSQLLDGLLGRFLLLPAPDEMPTRRRPKDLEPPADLVARCIAAAEAAKPTNPLAGVGGDPMLPSGCRTVPIATDAEDVLDQIEADLPAIRAAAKKRDTSPLWVRYEEHAIKLALVRACGVNPADPVVTAQDARWGVAVARWCLEAMDRYTCERVADSDRGRWWKRLLAIVSKAGEVTQSDLYRKTGKDLAKSLRLDLLSDLETAGLIVKLTKKTKGRPMIVYRIATHDLTDEEPSA